MLVGPTLFNKFHIVFVTVSHFHPLSNIRRQGWNLPEWSPLLDSSSKDMLLALPANIRLGQKWQSNQHSSLVRYKTD